MIRYWHHSRHQLRENALKCVFGVAFCLFFCPVFNLIFEHVINLTCGSQFFVWYGFERMQVTAKQFVHIINSLIMPMWWVNSSLIPIRLHTHALMLSHFRPCTQFTRESNKRMTNDNQEWMKQTTKELRSLECGCLIRYFGECVVFIWVGVYESSKKKIESLEFRRVYDIYMWSIYTSTALYSLNDDDNNNNNQKKMFVSWSNSYTLQSNGTFR